MRNPLYHWTHLELQRYFDVHELLNPDSAKKIYDDLHRKTANKGILRKKSAAQNECAVVCTTDDPTDTLEHHQKIKEDGFEIKILPAFRPDKAMNVDDVDEFNLYLKKLETVKRHKYYIVSIIFRCLKTAS